jgi:hypothetical protein
MRLQFVFALVTAVISFTAYVAFIVMTDYETNTVEALLAEFVLFLTCTLVSYKLQVRLG